jgi:glyoxylase-like metal-dependent hydrolase (beta-lactamase superfamily II)
VICAPLSSSRRIDSQYMQLPPNIRFIERDWLSANHVMFRGDHGATIVDTGYVRFADTTLERVEKTLAEWGDIELVKIVNTHIHSDHIGCNLALQRAHRGVSIAVPTAEESMLVNWDSPEQMLSYADQEAERFPWDETIEAGQQLQLGDEAWEVIATPGHDMGSVVLYSKRLRILISADAIWENGFGFVVPQTIDPKPLAAQRATFARLAELDVALVMPGHGRMFTDLSGALKRASEKLDAFAQDDMKIARNVVKGMFIYSLMWRGEMMLAELPNYVRQIGVHRDYNAQFFKMSDEVFARWLVDEAVKAGKAHVSHDKLLLAA